MHLMMTTLVLLITLFRLKKIINLVQGMNTVYNQNQKTGMIKIYQIHFNDLKKTVNDKLLANFEL